MAEFQLADGVRDASGGPPGQLRAAAGEDWRVIAACRSVDPELFFPISVAGKGLEEVAEAKRVCARCLVQAECLTFAQRTGQVHGIWGGLTEEERIRVRRPGPREPAAPLRSGLVPDVTLAQHLLQCGDPDDPAGTR